MKKILSVCLAVFILFGLAGCINLNGKYDPDLSIQLISPDSYDNNRFKVHSWDDKPGVYTYVDD